MSWILKTFLVVLVAQTISRDCVMSNGAKIAKASDATLEQTGRSRGHGSRSDWTQSFKIAKKNLATEPLPENKKPKQRRGLYHLISNYFGLSNILSKLKGSFYLELNCDSCKLATSMVHYFVRNNKTNDEIIQIFTNLCATFKVQKEKICRGIFPAFKDEFSYLIENIVFDTNEICAFIVGPQCSHKPSRLHNWEIHIPDKPSAVKKVKTTPPKDGKTSVLRVLHLSDTHYDPYYVEGSNADCGEPLCCREGAGEDIPFEKQAGRWGDYRSCDTPQRTLENMLEHIKQTHEIDYILWTGDLPPHDVWNQTKSTQIFHLYKMTEIMLKYFPDTPIFPAVGNHESSPVDSFPPPYIKSHSMDWLYSQLNHTWTHWIGSHASETIIKGAYYSVLVHPGFRIISINSNYCNNQNWWLLVNSTDPAQELQWLVFQLQKAEKVGEKVHIIGHIPPGSEDCLFVWSHNFYNIIIRYQDTVTAQFYGHAHVDEFQIFYERQNRRRRKPINVAYVGPSASPFKHLNPSYRIYTIDGVRDFSTWNVLDHETHYLNLTAANLYNSPVWIKEYSAKEDFRMKSLEPIEWDRLVKKFKYDDELFNKYYSYYTRMSDVYPECDSRCRWKLICDTQKAASNDQTFC